MYGHRFAMSQKPQATKPTPRKRHFVSGPELQLGKIVRKGKLRKSYNNSPKTRRNFAPTKTRQRKNRLNHNATQAPLCLRPRASARTNYETRTHPSHPQAALPLRPRLMSPIRGVHRSAPAQMGARNHLRLRKKQKKGQTSRPIHNTRQRPQHRLP